MLLHRTLAAIFLFLISAAWASSFTQVVAATYALGHIIAKDSQDVKEITLLTPLAAERIPDDIIRLAGSFNDTRLNNAGAKASNVSSTEKQLTDAYSNLTTFLINYTNDLESKITILETFGLKGAIFTNLVALREAAYEFQVFLEGLLEDPDSLNVLLQLGLQGAEAVVGAERWFQP